MPLIAKGNDWSGEKEIAPTGLHAAVCFSVEDVGHHEETYKGETKIVHKIMVFWEIDSVLQTGEFAGKRFVLSKFYTLSLGERANLRIDLKSWMGRDFTAEELEGFDVLQLIGKQFTLNVVHEDKPKGTFAAIDSVLPTQSTAQKLVPMTTETPAWIEKIKARAIPEDQLQQPKPQADRQLAEDSKKVEDDLPF